MRSPRERGTGRAKVVVVDTDDSDDDTVEVKAPVKSKAKAKGKGRAKITVVDDDDDSDDNTVEETLTRTTMRPSQSCSFRRQWCRLIFSRNIDRGRLWHAGHESLFEDGETRPLRHLGLRVSLELEGRSEETSHLPHLGALLGPFLGYQQEAH